MKTIQVLDKKFRLYIPQSEIAETVGRLAARLSDDMRGMDPLFMPILNGSFLFAADLLRAMDYDCEVSFVKMSSYSGTQTTGRVKELIGFPESVEGRHIVLVEDIVETGISMRYTLDQLARLHPASVRICTFFLKPRMFDNAFAIDYVGREIGDEFIVCYGLDYNGHGRTYRDVYVLDQ